MIILRVVLYLSLLLATPLILSSKAMGHGSVVADGDLCVIRIGFFTAHFKIFQPESSQEKEFCEDLPAQGESIFVMEYLHKDLGRVPIEFMIIRDTTGMGRFATLADVQKIQDLNTVTVFHQSPVIKADVFSVLYAFEGDGDYLGVVSALDPVSGAEYSAVFPFHVGERNWGFLPLFAVLLLLAQSGYCWSMGGWARWRASRKAGTKAENNSPFLKFTAHFSVLLVLSLLLPGAVPVLQAESVYLASVSGHYRVTFRSETMPLPLNQMHTWTIHLETAEGIPVEHAILELKGGMPAHNHGLATAPAISETDTAGDYRVDGIRFHMQGDWELTLSITDGFNKDTLVIPLVI